MLLGSLAQWQADVFHRHDRADVVPAGPLKVEQQEQSLQPTTYKEGLAQSNAAKGPKLQPLGPSETKSFVELGIAQSLSDHLKGTYLSFVFTGRRYP